MLGKAFPGDHLHVISSDFVSGARFSERGRNQREWTFFMALSRRDDAFMIMPEIVMHKDYQVGGLTDKAMKVRVSSPESLLNNIERSYCYWRRAPLNSGLFFNFIKQLISYPLKYLFHYFGAR